MAIENNNLSEPIVIPKYLFRYLRDDDNLIDTLTKPYLWFSAPESLNDPFDMSNVLEVKGSKEDLQWYSSNYDGRQYGVDPLSENNRKKYEKSLDSDEGRKKIFEAYAHVQSIMHGMYLKRIGICCFSYENNSPLMWSHYSSGHSGVVVVIDTIRMIPEFSLIKVQYESVLPKWNMIESRKLYGASFEYNRKFDQVVLGTKYKEWEYEREFRLISRCRSKHNLYPEVITGLILGARMPIDRKNEIKNMIESKHNHVAITEAVLDGKTGKILIDNFQNEDLSVMHLGWRHLDDPEEVIRSMDGKVLLK